ncbi:hypothetical protein [Staphylococcus sp. EZ-P03]|uniref:hypothetical protein n=1 Tax=Staphylococcus sp. EZ-P03 TaxID=2282739 RepID=UPI0013C44846|nr:hypothetical protein [Staphylococcus sp. EZ-P03]
MANKEPFNIENWILKKSKNQKKHNSKYMIGVTVIALVLLIIFMVAFKTDKVDVFAKDKKTMYTLLISATSL